LCGPLLGGPGRGSLLLRRPGGCGLLLRGPLLGGPGRGSLLRRPLLCGSRLLLRVGLCVGDRHSPGRSKLTKAKTDA